MMVWLLFIIGHMGLFFYNQKGSIISIEDLPTTEIIEPNRKIPDFFLSLNPVHQVKAECFLHKSQYV